MVVGKLSAPCIYVTSVQVRDKFARLTQISLILSVERVSEVSEYTASSMKCCLDTSEIKQCLKLRKDFRGDDINKFVGDL